MVLTIPPTNPETTEGVTMMNKCHTGDGNNAFWQCWQCERWCCHKHIEYVTIYKMAKDGSREKQHLWVCSDCAEKIKEAERNESTRNTNVKH